MIAGAESRGYPRPEKEVMKYRDGSCAVGYRRPGDTINTFAENRSNNGGNLGNTVGAFYRLRVRSGARDMKFPDEADFREYYVSDNGNRIVSMRKSEKGADGVRRVLGCTAYEMKQDPTGTSITIGGGAETVTEIGGLKITGEVASVLMLADRPESAAVHASVEMQDYSGADNPLLDEVVRQWMIPMSDVRQ